MNDWSKTTQRIIYTTGVTMFLLALTLLLYGDNSGINPDALKGEVFHSNYVLPHAGSDH